MFKLNKVLLAVTATLFAGQVFAVPVTQSDISSARGKTLQEAWISGASAPTYNIFLGFVAGCDANSVSVFHNNSSSTLTAPGSAGNFLAYACTRGGTVSVVYHTVDGGSLNAYSPHIPNDIGRPNVGTTNLRRVGALGGNNACVAQTGSIEGITNQTAIPSFGSCALVTPATLAVADKAPVLPAGGFSDVEAALFGLSTTGYGAEADANVGQVFGIATSVSLYRAMQAAQGITVPDPDFLPENAPNITRTQYASIVSGTGKTNILIPNSTQKLNLARRAPTSGTQGSSNAHFLRNPCNNAPTAGVLLPIGIADSDSTLTVTEGSGTGNAITALSTSEYAIGVLSLENQWRPPVAGGAAAGYRYIKLDGVHPEAPIPGAVGNEASWNNKARYTAAQGTYDFQIELKSFVASSAAGTFGETVIGDIVTAFAGLDCSAVPRGLTLTTFSGSSCTYGQVVSRATRFGNNCQPQQIFPINPNQP